MQIISKMTKGIILVLVNTVFSGTHFYSIKRALLNKCQGVSVGKGTRINTPISIPIVSEVSIGNNCWIGRDFALEGNGKVVIGDNCDLAPLVTCLTGSHAIGDSARRAGEGFNGSIWIGSGTWVGSRAVIMPNVSIESGNVIGAGAVITKNTQRDCLYAGVPAKLLRNL